MIKIEKNCGLLQFGVMRLKGRQTNKEQERKNKKRGGRRKTIRNI